MCVGCMVQPCSAEVVASIGTTPFLGRPGESLVRLSWPCRYCPGLVVAPKDSLGRRVVPDTYNGYFTATVTAAGTLIGLLFVANALRPDTVFGPAAPATGRVLAGSAFTA